MPKLLNSVQDEGEKREDGGAAERGEDGTGKKKHDDGQRLGVETRA
jgi:hypothetical protein